MVERTKSTRNVGLLLLAILAGGLSAPPAAAATRDRWIYLPSGRTGLAEDGVTPDRPRGNDGRMLVLTGDGFFTLSGNKIRIELAWPESWTGWQKVDFFDGDTSTGGSDSTGHGDGSVPGTWDVGGVPLNYTVYAD